MFEITKEFTFSASHRLTHLRIDHPCASMHGHNYVVKVTLRGETDDRGFVHDYRDLDFFKSYIDGIFDHKHLNEVMSMVLGLPLNDAARYTTAEHLAQYFYGWIYQTGAVPSLYSVSVSETPKTWATFIPAYREHDDRDTTIKYEDKPVWGEDGRRYFGGQ